MADSTEDLVLRDNSEAILGDQGVLSSQLDNFSPRASQQALAAAVERTLALEGRFLIAEAGTGTGKTFAYLVPAFLSDKKVIISTGTKNLQDQLFQGDLPRIAKALSSPLSTAILKGRSNYLCLYRIEQQAKEGVFHSPAIAEEFQSVRERVPQLSRGESNELCDIAEDSPVWPLVTSTLDNCLASDCPNYQDCFLVKARKRAQVADILVINHHLFFADNLLREDGLGEILPTAETIIFDEAHQLPDIASHFFGIRLSARQLFDLLKDITIEQRLAAKDMQALADAVLVLEKTIFDFRLSLGADQGRYSWQEFSAKKVCVDALEDMIDAITNLDDCLSLAQSRSKGLENCHQRLGDLLSDIVLFKQSDSVEQVLWVEVFTTSFSLNASPLSVADAFNEVLNPSKTSYVFTSATLSVDESFNHFSQQLGLPEHDSTLLDSPFDYHSQALLYMPRGIPDPKSADYIGSIVDRACPLIERLKGRTFFLFTSYSAMHKAAELLADRLPYKLLIQGSQAKSSLISQFKRQKDCVLLGTYSFWEGVDVKGSALSCVIIDKLPFESPFDPLIKARIQYMRKQGADPFASYQIPHAVIALKQGVGRLIRDEDDVGVMMLCDPRLTSRAYGKVFFASLPNVTKTRSEQKVLDFIDNKILSVGNEK